MRIHKILKFLKLTQKELSITFVNDSHIKKLNGHYRNKNKPTDVLSFSMQDKNFLGDIIISLDTAQKQAQQLSQPLRERCLFLIIHGILHLIGYDHIKDADWKKMSAMENKLKMLVE